MRYLRDTLQYEFPADAGAPRAGEQPIGERQQRVQAGMRQRLALLCAEGSEGEWAEGTLAARQLLAEMHECFAIMEEAAAQRPQRTPGEQARGAERAMPAAAAAAEGGAAAEAALEDAGDEGLEWEDVVVADAVAVNAGTGAMGEHGNGGSGGGGEAPEAGPELEAVQEMLSELYRQLTSRTLPQVQVPPCAPVPVPGA